MYVGHHVFMLGKPSNDTSAGCSLIPWAAFSIGMSSPLLHTNVCVTPRRYMCIHMPTRMRWVLDCKLTWSEVPGRKNMERRLLRLENEMYIS